jgi:hypothetical protein
MNFLDELREAAKTLPEKEAYEMRSIATTIVTTIDDLRRNPNDDSLRELNGLWARGRRLMVTPSSNTPAEKKIA